MDPRSAATSPTWAMLDVGSRTDDRQPMAHDAPTPDLPVGTVTFLLTDVDLSTPPAVLVSHRGVRLDHGVNGAGAAAVFASAADAVGAAIDLQRALDTGNGCRRPGGSWPAHLLRRQPRRPGAAGGRHRRHGRDDPPLRRQRCGARVGGPSAAAGRSCRPRGCRRRAAGAARRRRLRRRWSEGTSLSLDDAVAYVSRARGPAAGPPRGGPASRRPSSGSSASPSKASPIRRSRRASSSAATPSRPTSRTSTPSSTWPTAPSSRPWRPPGHDACLVRRCCHIQIGLPRVRVSGESEVKYRENRVREATA